MLNLICQWLFSNVSNVLKSVFTDSKYIELIRSIFQIKTNWKWNIKQCVKVLHHLSFLYILLQGATYCLFFFSVIIRNISPGFLKFLQSVYLRIGSFATYFQSSFYLTIFRLMFIYGVRVKVMLIMPLKTDHSGMKSLLIQGMN